MTRQFFEPNPQVKRALVLGGGGARGAFEIGVWKALNELGYEPNIITGTSVGALNGALFLQGKIEEAEKMWKQIETGHILEYEFPLSIDNFKDYQRTLGGFLIDAVRQKGLSSRPLQELIEKYLPDETIIRSSPITFGLSTTNYETRKIEYYFLEDIPHGMLSRYLLASSSLYPAMEKTYIDGTPYVDGGYRNNMPINMALDKDPDEMIVVDVHGPGLVKKDHRMKTKKVLWLSTKWHLGDLLLFHKARTEMNIELGYQETMKVAEEYKGFWYTFTKESLIEEHTSFYAHLDEVLKGEKFTELSSYIKEEAHQLHLLKACEEKWEKEIDKENFPLALLELAGKRFRVLPSHIYTVEEFQKEIVSRVEQFQERSSYQAPEELRPDFPLSGMEWTERFKEQLPLVSNRRMILFFLELLEEETSELSNKRYHFLFQLRPVPLVLALYIYYLKEKFKKTSQNLERMC